MDTPEKRKQLEELAQEVFELSKLGSLARARSRKDGVEVLSETENLTLELLTKREVMTVGEIQKSIGVLPAQMSRVIRSLEDKGGSAFISCAINPEDRRKIDVSITPEGLAAFEAYRSARLGMSMKVLAVLTLKEREDFRRILRKLGSHISKSI